MTVNHGCEIAWNRHGQF